MFSRGSKKRTFLAHCTRPVMSPLLPLPLSSLSPLSVGLSVPLKRGEEEDEEERGGGGGERGGERRTRRREEDEEENEEENEEKNPLPEKYQLCRTCLQTKIVNFWFDQRFIARARQALVSVNAGMHNSKFCSATNSRHARNIEVAEVFKTKT